MVTRALIALVRGYQRILSPLKRAPTCRYAPTCSCYAIEAIENRGPVEGSLWAVWRILRCNPLFHGGYHPAPTRRGHEVTRPERLETRPS